MNLDLIVKFGEVIGRNWMIFESGEVKDITHGKQLIATTFKFFLPKLKSLILDYIIENKIQFYIEEKYNSKNKLVSGWIATKELKVKSNYYIWSEDFMEAIMKLAIKLNKND